MEKKTRNILIASGIVLAGAVGAYFIFRKPKDTSGGSSNEGPQQNTGNSNSNNNNTTDPTQPSGNCATTNVVGKTAHVQGTFANTRETACASGDLVVKVDGSGTAIGVVEKVKLGCNDNTGSFHWYYVALTPDNVDNSGYDYGFYSSEHTHAWVRCDICYLT